MERLQGQVSQLTASVATMESENKILTAKLSALRNESRVPSSAVKNNHTGNGGRHGGAGAGSGGGVVGGGGGGGLGSNHAEVARVTQLAQLKENLYSDLTGLILPNVKRMDEADVFDCIQTGRNGSTLLPLPLTSSISSFILTLLLPMFDIVLCLTNLFPIISPFAFLLCHRLLWHC